MITESVKVAVVDDEIFDNFSNTVVFFQRLYGVENVSLFETGSLVLDNLSMNFDIIYVDKVLGGEYDGLTLGSKILSEKPSTILIMLTGVAANLITCKAAMEVGYCAFLDKANDITGYDKFCKTLDNITKTPHFISKYKSRELIKDKRLHIAQLNKKLNSIVKSRYLENFDEDGIEEITLDVIKKRLDIQEEIIKFALGHGMVLASGHLGAAMSLMENGDKLNISVLKKLGRSSNYRLFNLKNRPSAMYSMYFQLLESKGGRTRTDINLQASEKYRPNALIVMGLFSKYPGKWPITQQFADKSIKGESQYFTFVNDLIRELRN